MRWHDERGAGSLLVVCAGAVVLLLGAALSVVAAMVVAHRSAQSAADLAALAGAGDLGRGLDGCASAARVAAANQARLVRCDVSGRVLTVRVETRGPHWLGQLADLDAQARAGPQVTTALTPRSVGLVPARLVDLAVALPRGVVARALALQRPQASVLASVPQCPTGPGAREQEAAEHGQGGRDSQEEERGGAEVDAEVRRGAARAEHGRDHGDDADHEQQQPEDDHLGRLVSGDLAPHPA